MIQVPSAYLSDQNAGSLIQHPYRGPVRKPVVSELLKNQFNQGRLIQRSIVGGQCKCANKMLRCIDNGIEIMPLVECQVGKHHYRRLLQKYAGLLSRTQLTRQRVSILRRMRPERSTGFKGKAVGRLNVLAG